MSMQLLALLVYVLTSKMSRFKHDKVKSLVDHSLLTFAVSTRVSTD